MKNGKKAANEQEDRDSITIHFELELNKRDGEGGIFLRGSLD